MCCQAITVLTTKKKHSQTTCQYTGVGVLWRLACLWTCFYTLLQRLRWTALMRPQTPPTGGWWATLWMRTLKRHYWDQGGVGRHTLQTLFNPPGDHGHNTQDREVWLRGQAGLRTWAQGQNRLKNNAHRTYRLLWSVQTMNGWAASSSQCHHPCSTRTSVSSSWYYT